MRNAGLCLGLLLKQSWSKKGSHNKADLFKDPSDCPFLFPSCVDLSLGWFDQGHKVINAIHKLSFYIWLSFLQSNKFMPHVSASLQHDAGRRWATDMTETSSLIGAILNVCHPELYRAGHECIDRLLEHMIDSDIFNIWNSVFNRISAILNQETPFHCNGQTCAPWYDIICTLGGDDNTILEIQDLGIWLSYRSGTITALTGGFLYHVVSPCQAERLCYAYWMCDCVHEFVSVDSPEWMQRKCYGD